MYWFHLKYINIRNISEYSYNFVAVPITMTSDNDQYFSNVTPHIVDTLQSVLSDFNYKNYNPHIDYFCNLNHLDWD